MFITFANWLLNVCELTSTRLRTDQRRLRNDRWRNDSLAKRPVSEQKPFPLLGSKLFPCKFCEKKYIVLPPYRVVANKPRLLRNMFSVLNLPTFPENEQRRKHLVVRNLLPALISNPGHWVRSHNQMELKMLIVDFQKLCCINRKIKLDVKGKRHIQVENFSK